MSNQVTVTFAGDAKQLSRTFAQIERESNSLDRSIGSSSSGIVSSLGGIAKKAVQVGTVLAGLGAAAAIGLGRSLLSTADDASDLNEAISKVNVIFGESATSIHDWASTAADSFGLSRKEAESAAGAFGFAFTSMGLGAEESSNMSRSLTELAADLGSFHNADITDVIEAQGAAFRGEYDSLDQYISGISAASVEQRALEMSGKSASSTLTDQEEMMAVYALMFENAGVAVGDFARTSEGAANSTKSANARIADMRAELGQRMLPITQKLTEWKLKLATAISDFLGPAIDKATSWFGDHRDEMEDVRDTIKDKVIPAVVSVAKAIGNGLRSAVSWVVEHKDTWIAIAEAAKDFGKEAYSAIQEKILPPAKELAKVVGEELGDAFAWFKEHKQTFIDLASTIRDVVLTAFTTLATVIGGAITVVTALFTFFTENKDLIASIFIGIATVLAIVFVPAMISAGIAAVAGFGAWAVGAAAAAVATLAAVWPLLLIGVVVAALAYLIINNWDWIKEKTGDIWDWVSEKVTTIWDAISSFVSEVWDNLSTTISDHIDTIKDVFNAFKDTVSDIWEAIGDAMLDPIDDAVTAIKRVWNNTVGGKSLKIPGIPGIFDGASFTIPSFAEGGIIPATQGGRIIRVAEGGEAEAVVPLSRLEAMQRSGGGTTVIELRGDGSRMSDLLIDLLRSGIRSRGGNVQAVLA